MDTTLIILIILVAAAIVFALIIRKQNSPEGKRNAAIKAMEGELGRCTYCEHGYGFDIARFDESRTIVINGSKLNFSDIKGCRIDTKKRECIVEIPEQTIIKSSSKANTASVLGRTVVGTLVAGPIGAAIGGATAKRTITTTTTTRPAETRKDTRTLYTIIIETTKDGLEQITHTTGDEQLAAHIKNLIDSL